jgi:hypothetical protein
MHNPYLLIAFERLGATQAELFISFAHRSPVRKPAAGGRLQATPLPSKSLRRIRFSGRLRLSNPFSLPPLAGDTGPPTRRVFVFLGLGCSESGPNHRALRGESLLFADSRQRRFRPPTAKFNVLEQPAVVRS